MLLSGGLQIPEPSLQRGTSVRPGLHVRQLSCQEAPTHAPENTTKYQTSLERNSKISRDCNVRERESIGCQLCCINRQQESLTTVWAVESLACNDAKRNSSFQMYLQARCRVAACWMLYGTDRSGVFCTTRLLQEQAGDTCEKVHRSHRIRRPLVVSAGSAGRIAGASMDCITSRCLEALRSCTMSIREMFRST